MTTPSTIYLESVLRELPTAWLDFHNSPQYISSAWTISSSGQIETVVNDLASPPSHKLVYQKFCTSRSISESNAGDPATVEIDPIACPRLVAWHVKRECRLNCQQGFCLTRGGIPERLERNLRWMRFIPVIRYLENDDPRRLQIELAAAIKRLEQLPCELAEKNKYIAKLMRSLDRSRETGGGHAQSRCCD